MEHTENSDKSDETKNERLRCVGVILSEYAIWKLKGEERIAHVLDELASKVEHPEIGV